MPSPLVSVIMPCFNAGPMLRAALRSVVEQSYPAIEIVFVDNNSTDGSAALAREIAAGAPHRSWRFAECSEQGVNRARNLGFSLASGAYIQWMDADDSLDKDKIALQVAALEAAPETDIAYGDWTICHIETARPNLERRHNLSQDDDQVLRALAGVWYPPHLYLLRRSAAQQLQDAQAWWPARTVATDVEYTALAALLGLRFRHVAGAHVSYNIWSRGQTSNATTYAARIAALAAIFTRLRQCVEAGGAKVALSRRHKVLLHQGWEVWRVARDVRIEASPRRRLYRLSRSGSGQVMEVRPREAAIARAMLARPRALAVAHHALLLAETVPQLGHDHTMIIETLEDFCQRGFLERAPADAASHLDP